MRSRELSVLASVAALLVSTGAAGCLHNPDPRPRSMSAVHTDARGGFVVVRIGDEVNHQGELIAIGPEGVWVLAGQRLIRTPHDQVSDLEVFAYDVSIGGVAAWGLLGTLSTISHGFFLVLSAPVWLVTTIATSASHSASAHRFYANNGKDDWSELAKWARFPQGMPPGQITAEQLLGRPVPAPPGPPSSVDPIGPAAPAAPAAPPAPAPVPAPAPAAAPPAPAAAPPAPAP